MTRARSLGVLAAMAAVLIAGCGPPFSGSSAADRGASSAAAPGSAPAPGSVTARGSATARDRAVVAQAQRTHEIPTPAPATQARWGWRSPVEAVQVFAEWYINWTASTVATHMRVLAQIAIGPARSAMTLAAAQVGGDSSLKLGGIANAGTVEGIAPVTGEDDVYAVVTKEETTATNTNAYRGLRPAWHVTLATVARVFGRLWTISAWQPEN